MYINLHVGIPAETWEEGIVGMKEAREFHEGWLEEFLGSCERKDLSCWECGPGMVHKFPEGRVLSTVFCSLGNCKSIHS